MKNSKLYLVLLSSAFVFSISASPAVGGSAAQYRQHQADSAAASLEGELSDSQIFTGQGGFASEAGGGISTTFDTTPQEIIMPDEIPVTPPDQDQDENSDAEDSDAEDGPRVVSPNNSGENFTRRSSGSYNPTLDSRIKTFTPVSPRNNNTGGSRVYVPR